MILSTLLHEEDQSQVADLVKITWQPEEVVLIYTSCRIYSKTIMGVWGFCVYCFVLWGFFNHSSCFSTHQDDILDCQCRTVHSFMAVCLCYYVEDRVPYKLLKMATDGERENSLFSVSVFIWYYMPL